MSRVNGRFAPPTSDPEPVRKRGGLRALANGAPRLLGRHDAAEGRCYSRHYAALLQRLGPFDALTSSFAGAVAALHVTFAADTAALNLALEARRRGQGRRPSAAAIARLEKRQGLAWQSYDSALKRLEGFTQNPNGHGGPADKLGDIARAVEEANR